MVVAHKRSFTSENHRSKCSPVIGNIASRKIAEYCSFIGLYYTKLDHGCSGEVEELPRDRELMNLSLARAGVV